MSKTKAKLSSVSRAFEWKLIVSTTSRLSQNLQERTFGSDRAIFRLRKLHLAESLCNFIAARGAQQCHCLKIRAHVISSFSPLCEELCVYCIALHNGAGSAASKIIVPEASRM
jgi:hypothetical protein